MKVTFFILPLLLIIIFAISKLYSQEVVSPDSINTIHQQLVDSSSNNSFVNIFSALLTPLIALFVAYIAWQQHRTNKQKLKLDLFDRRFEVYEATKKYLAKIGAKDDVTRDDLVNFNIETNKSYFLFGNDIQEYLNELHSKGVILHSLNKKLRTDKLSQDEREEVIEKEGKNFEWLTDQLTKSKDIFGKYMRFKR